MTDEIKCPVCGSNTRLRASKKDGSKYFVCVNYPECKGKVAFVDEFEDVPDKKTVSTKSEVQPSRSKKPIAIVAVVNAPVVAVVPPIGVLLIVPPVIPGEDIVGLVPKTTLPEPVTA